MSPDPASTASRAATRPAEGERSAVVGFSGQYGLAARAVRAKMTSLEWIRVADPHAGAADDFQFQAGGTRYAMQVKWAQYPGGFGWAELVHPAEKHPPLIGRLAEAWSRVRQSWAGPLEIRLWSNEHPSTAKPRAGSVLASCAVEPPRHFAAFLARSWAPVRQRLRYADGDWSQVETHSEITEWRPAWDALRRAVGLDPDSFAAFICDLDLHFGPAIDDQLLRPDEAPQDTDLEHLATTLQALVADPARPVELSRQALLERLGWEGRVRFRNPHVFPVPAVYAANEAARSQVQARLDGLPGGYVALVGPAGSGKSTLLASLTWPNRRLVRYYAFVPDSSDPLSGRGEAESFFHDVSLALEGMGIRRPGYGNDLAAQRAVLHDQLRAAGERWRSAGEVTVIIVDGIDHVPREQNPSRSLLDELPPPAALPDGLFIVLGTQTTDILPSLIREALAHDSRTVELPPLTPAEVLRIADAAGPGSWLLPGQRDDLVAASEGHPLALSYLLQDLGALESTEHDPELRRLAVDRLLSDASAYGGEVTARYRGYLQAAGEDRELLDVLAAVARLRTPIDVEWLKTWVPISVLEPFVARTATFFRREGTVWRFIHNSFRRFLIEETARVAGRFDAERDRALHVSLADICGRSEERWSLYRDEELAHRYLAGDYARVIALASPTILREKLFGLRPIAVVRDQARVALRAAADTGDAAGFVRMLLFHNELFQRELIVSPETLAEAMVGLEAPAIEHVVAAGRLRVPVKAALTVAARLARQGLFEAAGEIRRVCGGLSEVVEEDPLSAADWAEVVLRSSGLSEVLAQVNDQLSPVGASEDLDAELSDVTGDAHWAGERRRREQADRQRHITSARNAIFARCFDLLLEVRDESNLEILLALIDEESSSGWRARARVARALAAREDGDTGSVLRWSREVVDLNSETRDRDEEDEEDASPSIRPRGVPLSLRLQAAHALVLSGLLDASEIDQLVPPETRVAWPSVPVGSDGLAPFETFIDLQRLRVVRPAARAQLSNAPSSTAETSEFPNRRRSAGDERFRRALCTLATLEGHHLLSTVGRGGAPNVAAEADEVIRLLEVPLRQTRDWTSWYYISNAAPGLFRRLSRLAAVSGPGSLSALLDRFAVAWADSDRATYWSPLRQLHVLRAVLSVASADVADEVHQHLSRLHSALTEFQAGPQERAELWLELARAWADAGQSEMAVAALGSAMRTSWGPGGHDDDRQLEDWLGWLSAAVDTNVVGHEQFLEAARTYASRLVSAKGADGEAAEAASDLVQMVWPVDPFLSTLIAETLCDRGILKENDAVEAVLLGAARDRQVPVALAAIAVAELLIPLRRQPPDELRDLISQRDDPAASGAVEVIDHAIALWSAPDDGSAEASAEDVSAGSPSEPDGPSSAPLPQSVTALLVEMRRAVPGAASHYWSRAVEVVTDCQVTPALAHALLGEAVRLRLDGEALGWIADLAARAGLAEEAEGVLVDALGRTPAYGWIRFYDGGSRLKLMAAALRHRDQTLARLAARDLAGVVSTGALSGQILPNDLRRVVELINGELGVASAWPQVEEHLEVFAPALEELPEVHPSAGPSGNAAEVLLRWIAGYFGHPVRQRDFGARRVLQAALEVTTCEAEAILAESISRGDWVAEAALQVLLAREGNTRPPPADLSRALFQAAVSDDAICRDLARKLCARHAVNWDLPPYRPLAGTYRLVLPALPERSVPFLDERGVPMIDPNDPQQVVAPFDLPLRLAAGAAGIEEETVLHRAAAIARGLSSPWLRGGHQAHASRLTQRGESHSYRPWAFMAGRRALGVVLAELADARALDADFAQAPAYGLDLIDEVLLKVAPAPLDDTTPSPWLPAPDFRFDARGWCSQAEDASRHYAAAAQAASTYVVAELTDWVRLEWEMPEERRTIKAGHGRSDSNGILLPRRARWEHSYAPANDYVMGRDLLWSHRELIVEGWEMSSDPPWSRWLALHPAVARLLGWTPDPTELFAWVGDDGAWRARSVVRSRGQLSHQPYAHTYCAEGWQVVLSSTGLAEIRGVFGSLQRVLTVERTLPARPRDESPAADTSRFRSPLVEPN